MRSNTQCNNHTSQIFFSAGEPSGDAHAASLIKEVKALNPTVRCVGYGGPLMTQAGLELHQDLTQKAIMFSGFAPAQLKFYYNLYKRAQKYFQENNVQAVVLVDYPGFNWWIARAAKQQGIPVHYFMPPQLWAWAGWRIKKMRRLVDHVFTTMPFETQWFRRHGCRVSEIGHPFLEEAKHHKVDFEFVSSLKSEEQPILTILPGSRDQEIANNFDDLLSTVAKVRQAAPNVRPMIAAFKQEHADVINQKLSERRMIIPVYVGRTQELIRAAHFALSVSGSVTMELLANHVPTVVYYKVGRMGHLLQRFFRRSRYITLVNLLGIEQFTPGSPYYPQCMKVIPAYPTDRDFDDMLFPEFLTWDDASEAAADAILAWHDHPKYYSLCKDKLRILHENLDPKIDPFRVAAQKLVRHVPEKNEADFDEGGDMTEKEPLQEDQAFDRRQTA